MCAEISDEIIAHSARNLKQSFNKNRTLLAGEEGIEPSLSVLETDVLPLNYSPINKILFESPKRKRVDSFSTFLL